MVRAGWKIKTAQRGQCHKKYNILICVDTAIFRVIHNATSLSYSASVNTTADLYFTAGYFFSYHKIGFNELSLGANAWCFFVSSFEWVSLFFFCFVPRNAICWSCLSKKMFLFTEKLFSLHAGIQINLFVHRTLTFYEMKAVHCGILARTNAHLFVEDLFRNSRIIFLRCLNKIFPFFQFYVLQHLFTWIFQGCSWRNKTTFFAANKNKLYDVLQSRLTIIKLSKHFRVVSRAGLFVSGSGLKLTKTSGLIRA